jgi:hypothetical protein
MAGNGTSLAVMDFACGAQAGSVACSGAPTFSGLREAYRAPDGEYVGWPSFSPDSKMMIFQHTVAASGDNGSVLNTRSNARAELWVADVPDAAGATRFEPQRLCAANGYADDCTTSYLPTNDQNHASDVQLNFEPNVTPIAAGGYFWVIFTTRRLYGNVATTDPYTPFQGGPAATSPPTKKLWMAAIDMNPEPGKDPSHPAFYLPGQEIMSGNTRAFWVAEPCHDDGNSCTTGDECCSGYCNDDGNGNATCGPRPSGCVPQFNRCLSNDDCCGGGDLLICVGGYCTQKQGGGHPQG